MKIFISNQDAFFTPAIRYYGLAHCLAWLTTMNYYQLYLGYPIYSTVSMMGVFSYFLARFYKICFHRTNSGLGCLFPILIIPYVTPLVFYQLTYINHWSEILPIFDILIFVIGIYLFLIRWANVMNSELIGRPPLATSRFVIEYERHRGPRLPVQIYSSLVGFGIIVFHLLNPPHLNNLPPGSVYLITTLIYSLQRFIEENYKDHVVNHTQLYWRFNREQVISILIALSTIVQVSFLTYLKK